MTNEQVIQELLALANQIFTANQEGIKLGLTNEELAFYDALTNPEAIKDFYTNAELIKLTKELTDTLRKNKTIDWQERNNARAKMRMMIKRLLKKYKYPLKDLMTPYKQLLLNARFGLSSRLTVEAYKPMYFAPASTPKVMGCLSHLSRILIEW